MQGLLACPVCGAALTPGPERMHCERGHSFDVARQGYVNLLTGNAPAGLGDSADMVSARASFLDSGHYDPLIDAVAEAAEQEAGDGGGALVDVGAGTAHYLAAALDRMPGRSGLALDASRYAARRAARAHCAITAAVCDVWRVIPVRDGAARVLLNTFAPRNGAEMARVLAPAGTLLVATPSKRHLAELREPLRLLAVDERKVERVDVALGGYLSAGESTDLEAELRLDHHSLRDLVAMGPSTHHTDPAELERRISALPDPAGATLSVAITRWHVS